MPPYKCREYMAEMDKNKNGRIEMEEFLLVRKRQMMLHLQKGSCVFHLVHVTMLSLATRVLRCLYEHLRV